MDGISTTRSRATVVFFLFLLGFGIALTVPTCYESVGIAIAWMLMIVFLSVPSMHISLEDTYLILLALVVCTLAWWRFCL